MTALTLDLKRVLQTPDFTFGTLIAQHTGEVLCLTLERPWRQNQRRVSCIPEGTYDCDPNYVSPAFGKRCIGVAGVPGRSHILFHQGNKVEESKGCILVGLGLWFHEGEFRVASSRKALDRLFNYLNGDCFKLVVSHAAARVV